MISATKIMKSSQKARDLLQKSTQNNVKSLCANTFIKKYALLLRSKRAYA